MTKLLVSVRDADEAELALRAGADLIDVKEPARGSLGAADFEVASEIASRYADRCPVSVALGELSAAATGHSVPHGATHWKMGLAGCALRPSWRNDWNESAKRQPANCSAVAVVYADWETAKSPSPEQVIEHAEDARVRAVLVDTWKKDGGHLLEHWSLDEIERFICRIQSLGILAAVAGSLNERAIQRLLPLRPDIIAVRGAACSGGRTGTLCRDRVAALKELVGANRVYAGSAISA